jgi:hypothetical protein
MKTETKLTAEFVEKENRGAVSRRWDSNVVVRAIGDLKLTLAQKLAAFDPALHGGELMATRPAGNEVL